MRALSIGQKSVAGLLLVVLTRLLLLPLYPLMDTTEARYGEMARLMVETGNWVTPLFDYDVPFWGKPPLHTWMSAASIVVLGVSEFAVRFPHWIAAMLTLAVVATFAKQQRLPVLPSLIILASTAVFIVSAGAVMTDMALTLGLTMAMVGFYLCWQGEVRWGYFGFIGLAIGLLAKGPVALVIFAIGTGLWLLWQYGVFRPWKLLWQRIPLLTGLLLMLAIALPWYVVAENATPGFLNYFIVGEHWSRFVDSGWQGDLYGSAHDQTRGTIWLYFIGAALPWSAFLPQALYKIYVEAPKHTEQGCDSNDGALASYLICWMLAPMMLFTLAGNILPAYVLPGIPALALVITFAWRGSQVPHLHKVAIAIAVLLMVAVAIVHFGSAKDKSERWLLQQRTEILPTYYFDKRPFSARFYSAGKAKEINSLAEINHNDTRYYLVVDNSKIELGVEGCEKVANNKDRGLLYCSRSS